MTGVLVTLAVLVEVVVICAIFRVKILSLLPWYPGLPERLDDGIQAVDETVEKSNAFLENLRDEARRELQRQREYPKSREHPKSDEGRVRQEYPNLDEAAVGEIVDNVAGVYELIDDICRSRLHQERPESDEVEVQMRLMLIARPGPRMIESALVQRMHLPAQERLQQVAEMMVDKVLGRRL